ncbi:MAG: 4Fe-4S dicluster domain-containing protein [Ignavibacteriae bacterium]|nr:4Fe-4S dicluster domain-containing protein [Ignavibacteriota bacterium]
MDDIDRRKFLKLGILSSTGILVGSLYAFSTRGVKKDFRTYDDLLKYDWGFIVDTTRCIGCGSCVRACKVENNVPDTFFRTWVERFEINKNEAVRVDSPNGALESFKENNFSADVVKAFFVPKLCNHCYNSACTQVCPVGASFHSPDGVVLIDKDHCVGCGYCVQACPYGCRYIDTEKGTADKCTLCYHRIQHGELPACVNACPRNARIFGNLKDPKSAIRKILHQRRYGLLKAELGTNPKCYYIGLDLEVK